MSTTTVRRNPEALGALVVERDIVTTPNLSNLRWCGHCRSMKAMRRQVFIPAPTDDREDPHMQPQQVHVCPDCGRMA